MKPPRLHSALLLLLALALPGAEAPAPAPAPAPPADSPALRLKGNKQLAYARAEAIPVEPWRLAVESAVANGIAALAARQQTPANSTGLIVPPDETRKIERWEVRPLPYTRKTVKEPIFEWVEVQRLVPIKDSNGTVIGREMKTVRVPGKVTGYKEVERLVRDPAGTEMIDTKIPIYGPGGPAQYFNGIIGFNGMALYVLARAGLAASPECERQVAALETFLHEVGIPDQTYDLAWLAIGMARLPPTPERRYLVERLASRLLDGQIRDGAAAGLWGPVSVNLAQLAACLELERQLSLELEKVETQFQATGNKQTAAKLQAERNKLSQRRSAVREALRESSSQGHRTLEVTQAWNPDSAADAHQGGRVLSGLAYYFYNRQVGDLDSTALALLALAELRAAGLLPAGARREPVEGRKLAPALATDAVLALAAKAVLAAQLPDGTSTATCVSQVGTAFDKAKLLPLPQVPFTTEHPPLLNPRTLQSALAGASALRSLQALDPALVKADAVAKAEPLAQEAVRRWWTQETLSKAQATRWFLGLSIEDDVLMARKGWLLPPPAPRAKNAKPGKEAAAPPEPLAAIGTDLPLDQLSSGGQGIHAGLAPYLLPWMRSSPGAPAWQTAALRELAFRLMVTQSEHGQWRNIAGNPSMTTAEIALLMERRGFDRLRTLERRQGMKEPAKPPKAEDLRLFQSGSLHGCPVDAVGTVLSLAMLVEGLAGPVTLEGITILPKPAEGEAAALPGTPDEAAKAVVRPNPALLELLTAMGAPAPAPAAAGAAPEPAAPAEPAEPAEPAPVEEPVQAP